MVLQELGDGTFENEDRVGFLLELMLEVLALEVADEGNLLFVSFDVHDLHIVTVDFEANFISHYMKISSNQLIIISQMNNHLFIIVQ